METFLNEAQKGEINKKFLTNNFEPIQIRVTFCRFYNTTHIEVPTLIITRINNILFENRPELKRENE
jgi:hypothetical protein